MHGPKETGLAVHCFSCFGTTPQRAKPQELPCVWPQPAPLANSANTTGPETWVQLKAPAPAHADDPHRTTRKLTSRRISRPGGGRYRCRH